MIAIAMSNAPCDAHGQMATADTLQELARSHVEVYAPSVDAVTV